MNFQEKIVKRISIFSKIKEKVDNKLSLIYIFLFISIVFLTSNILFISFFDVFSKYNYCGYLLCSSILISFIFCLIFLIFENVITSYDFISKKVNRKKDKILNLFKKNIIKMKTLRFDNLFFKIFVLNTYDKKIDKDLNEYEEENKIYEQLKNLYFENNEKFYDLKFKINHILFMKVREDLKNDLIYSRDYFLKIMNSVERNNKFKLEQEIKDDLVKKCIKKKKEKNIVF